MSGGVLQAYRRLAKSIRIKYSKFVETYDLGSAFQHTRVVVIGPNCQMDQRDREHIDAADVCIVMNKGRRMGIYPELQRRAKRIAYFHCLDESERWGGGPLDTLELKRAGYKELFYPLADAELEHNVWDFHFGNQGMLKLRRIEPALHAEIVRSLGGFRPTSGLAIASALARTKGCRVYVSGITFYRKAYMPEYAAHLQDLASIKEQMEAHGVHHPDREYLEFMRLQQTYGIEVDHQLEAILRAPYTPLFYTAPGDERLVHPPKPTDP